MLLLPQVNSSPCHRIHLGNGFFLPNLQNAYFSSSSHTNFLLTSPWQTGELHRFQLGSLHVDEHFVDLRSVLNTILLAETFPPDYDSSTDIVVSISLGIVFMANSELLPIHLETVRVVSSCHLHPVLFDYLHYRPRIHDEVPHEFWRVVPHSAENFSISLHLPLSVDQNSITS